MKHTEFLLLGCAEQFRSHRFFRSLRLDKSQHPVFQAQMHVRCHVPFLKVVPLNTMPSKLRVANPQLIFAHVMHFVAPIAGILDLALNPFLGQHSQHQQASGEQSNRAGLGYCKIRRCWRDLRGADVRGDCGKGVCP